MLGSGGGWIVNGFTPFAHKAAKECQTNYGPRQTLKEAKIKPRAIVHAGTHKTGTTAIQTFLGINRQALFEQGFLYPEIFGVNGRSHKEKHHDLAHALAGQSKGMSPDDADKIASGFAKTARHGKTLLLSAEPIWRHQIASPGADYLTRRAAYLERLSQMLSAFDVEIRLVFRNPIDFMTSLYAERLTNIGTSYSLSDFAEAQMKTVGRYGDNARLFAATFPVVKCLAYEDLRRDDLLSAFARDLGLDPSSLKSPGIVRASADPGTLMARNFLWSCVPEGTSRPKMDRLVATDEVQSAIKDYATDNRHRTFWKNDAERRAVLEAHRPQMDILVKEFGLGEADSKFFESTPTEHDPVMPVPASLKAQLSTIAEASAVLRPEGGAGAS